MKKISVILLSLVMGMMLTLNAQAPYKHSIGGTFLSYEAFSYKTFLTDNLALSVDAGLKWTVTPISGTNMLPMSIEVNPNVMYEAPAGGSGLHWLVGGGLSMGYVFSINSFYSYNASCGKFGVNAIGGIEYKFKIPLTLQADFRPGYGLLFTSKNNASYFDWALCVGVRYVFH